MPAELPLVASPITGGDPRGVDSADALARLVAKELGLDHPARERVSMNAVYRCGTAVIRVSRPTVDPIVAIDTAHFLLDKRIPTAVPFVDRSFHDPHIDHWDLLSSSSVVWDHAPLMRWTSRWSERSSKVSDPYLEFSEGYGTSLIDDPLAEALAELRLLVATLMRAKSAMNDPTGRAEAAKRLGYWTGEDDRPWNAV
ncbi:MAG: hypothetical protein EBX99_01410 [Acidimicrobiia bacterium]|nr:hypothetical protein [Acidimicrobiia bacterium]